MGQNVVADEPRLDALCIRAFTYLLVYICCRITIISSASSCAFFNIRSLFSLALRFELELVFGFAYTFDCFIFLQISCSSLSRYDVPVHYSMMHSAFSFLFTTPKIFVNGRMIYMWFASAMGIAIIFFFIDFANTTKTFLTYFIGSN